MGTVEFIELFAKHGLTISFLVGLIVTGLVSALLGVLKYYHAREKERDLNDKERERLHAEEKKTLQAKIDSLHSKRLAESKERGTELMNVTRDNTKALSEVVGTVNALKDAIYMRDPS